LLYYQFLIKIGASPLGIIYYLKNQIQFKFQFSFLYEYCLFSWVLLLINLSTSLEIWGKIEKIEKREKKEKEKEKLEKV